MAAYWLLGGFCLIRTQLLLSLSESKPIIEIIKEGNTRNTRGEIHVANIVRAEKGACIEVKQLSKCPPAHHHHPTDTENACL